MPKKNGAVFHFRLFNIHKDTLYSKSSWGTTYIFKSPSFPAVSGLPGSVYLHDTDLRLGVVDDLWNLPVLHRRTVVIPRWAEKQKRRLRSCCGFLGHLLQTFGAIMGVWSLGRKNYNAGNRLI